MYKLVVKVEVNEKILFNVTYSNPCKLIYIKIL